MKRFLSFTLFGLGTVVGTVVLAGCPIYPDSGSDHRVCDGQGCYDCPDDYRSNSCTTWQCSSDYDCPGGYACDSTHACSPGGAPVGTCSKPGDCYPGDNCGGDGYCHPGDCTSTGCVDGYVCKLSGGSAQCVPVGTPVDAGPKPDGGFSGCTNDSQCTTPGARCLDGECVAPAGQCSDSTQCPANEKCVQGACTPACDATTPCPVGYSCDVGKNVCTGNPTPCGAGGTTCAPGTVCAQDHCVAPCGGADGGVCAAGSVCVQGGCVPDAKPSFTCATEGVQDVCAAGSICLHHSCYIACNPDAGADACKSADRFNVCKSVKTSTNTYSVCGSSTNLGTECDPTQGKLCTTAGAICIDGFCR